MELKPGYKLTEVGVIPEDWDSPTLGAILKSMQLGGNYRNREQVTNWPLIKMGNLARGHIKLDKLEYVDAAKQPDMRDRLQNGDVLFNTRNTIDLVGKVAIWRCELPEAYFNSNIMRMEFDRKSVASTWFMNSILNTPKAVSQLRGIATGTTSVAAIYSRDLVKVYLPLPPKAEQEAIAEALSDADALIESLDQLITKKRHLKQGAMQGLLTGKRRRPGFSGEWEVKRLGDFGSCLRGVTYKGDSDLYAHDTHLTKRLLRSNNVQLATIVTTDVQFVHHECVSEAQILKPRDILICMANGSKDLVGKAGLFNLADGFDYTFGAFMGCFRTDTALASSEFVFFLFQTGRYRSHINILLAGSSINNLRPSSIESLEFDSPTLPEQTAIATILSDMDTELAELESRLGKARQIKQGMMQELLTGRIRLL